MQEICSLVAPVFANDAKGAAFAQHLKLRATGANRVPKAIDPKLLRI
jgi:hypothetical protein